jgi:hypothetical protein
MKKTILTLWCTLCIAVFAFAQQKYFIHENVIKPSMSQAYEASIKKLRDACTQHKINLTWSTMRYDDNTYGHFFPIAGLGALDKSVFEELYQKMDKQAFESIWTDISKCIETDNEVVVTSLPHLTYLPPTEGENYRAILFFSPLPGKWQENEMVFAEWKKAYEAKKAPSGFQIFRIMFGNQSGYAVVISAKSMADFSDKQNKTFAVAQDDINRLWTKQMSLVKKTYWRYGYFIPELGYTLAAN